MESLILLGFVLLGAGFMGLGFGHRSWQVHRSRRQISYPSLPTQADRRISTYDPMQVRHFREPYLSNQQTPRRPTRRHFAADELVRVSRSQPEKIAVDQMAVKRSQDRNPAIEPWRMNQARQANLAFKSTSIKTVRPIKPANGYPASIPPQPINPTFKPTQTRRPRQVKPADGSPTTLSPQPISPPFKPTQTRRPRQAKQADGYPASIPLQPINPVFKLTEIRRSGLVSPGNDQLKAIPPRTNELADDYPQIRSTRRAKPADTPLDTW